MSGGGGCGTNNSRTMTCDEVGGGAAGGDGGDSARSGGAGGVSCTSQATTKTSVIDARSVRRISVRFMVCSFLNRFETYCQRPGSQSQFWPCGVHCPGTQVVVPAGGCAQCPVTHCQLLFQDQYHGTQT